MKALVTLAIVAFGLTTIGASPVHTTLRGFTPQSSARERIIESQFIDIPSAQQALEIATAIGARPHYAGTAGDYALAVYMRDTMRSAGIRAELESFTARVDTPARLALQLLPGEETQPARDRKRHTADPVTLDLREAADPSDAATSMRGIDVPFNSGSGDGDIRAPLVYASSGLDADYATLAQAGVEVRDAVVLVRYGAQFRGLLAERAQMRGAAGVLFYSDPQDDGSARGVVYPDGPWRPLTAIQRGWVGTNIRIPTLPISAANARVLLASLHGAAGPAGWSGALHVAYRMARGPGRIHLVVALNRRLTTLWNTIGVIPGVLGEQSVILGAHRDAWVYGVGNNGDGIATMLEVTRALGFLLEGGWRPARSIVIAGWDGAEIGLAGSRAYVLRHRLELDRGCVAYLNADENITGPHFGADAVAAIAPIVLDVTHEVADPLIPAATIYDRWAAQSERHRPFPRSPGGGSDHEPFIDGAGIPVANIGFSGPFGVDDSSYDTLRYAKLFSDPAFALHRTTAQLYGIVALRLADADSVPYTFAGYVGLLRAGAAQIAAHAARENIKAAGEPLGKAIDRLAYAARRADSRLAGANLNPIRILYAARALDSLIYGVDGYASVTFPGVESAFATHDAVAVDGAIGAAVDTLNKATEALAS